MLAQIVLLLLLSDLDYANFGRNKRIKFLFFCFAESIFQFDNDIFLDEVMSKGNIGDIGMEPEK